ncbi:hypothetical protein GALMADRAFT_418624 [Galerina marginata CBS 339.88]|uniref:F-box domain-containing protein n=1 Tax=Galerina marginata (strain CBS 339.88) TaxID=685588 RepID=A0A067T194_GALM3|nr:hypothetical protein GALMADRAFT_418624 [Galerina marginata CBS 339.88]
MTKRKKRVRPTDSPGTTTHFPVPTSGILLLPLELIYLILSSCSNAMLVSLAQTCKMFNTIALHAFFKREAFSKPAKGFLSSNRAPTEILDATRTALFVKRIHSVNWVFKAGCECKIGHPQADPQCLFLPSETRTSADIARTVSMTGPLWRTLDEIANLQAIISRMPEVRYVNLDFTSVGTWLRSVLRRSHPCLWNEKVNIEVLERAFVGLLDNILDKGCTTLLVSGGKELKRLLSGESSQHSMSPTNTTHKHLKLETLSIHSDILLVPPFYDWTLSLFTSSACADTLVSLSFWPQMEPIPSSLLASLDLPNLVEFEIRYFCMTNFDDLGSQSAEFEGIAAFLKTHHEQLQEVTLNLVGLPSMGSTTPITVSAFDSREPVFPNLQSIAAHPAYIVWLLDLAASSGSKTTLGNLTSIDLQAEDYGSRQPFDYALFNEALNALVSWQNGYRGGENVHKTRSSTKNKNVRPGRMIELTFTLHSEHGLCEWFASHLPPPPGSASSVGDGAHSSELSILTRLMCVSTLAICIAFPGISAEMVEHIPDWLALIPNAGASSNLPGSSRRDDKRLVIRIGRLRMSKFKLEYYGSSFPVDKDQFIKRIADKCVGLKWIEMDKVLSINDPIDLDEVRAGTSLGNVET